MSNYEYLMNNMTPRELASYLVNEVTVDNGDYHYDGEDEYWQPYYEVEYVDMYGDYHEDYDEAIDANIMWLKSKVEKG